VPKPRQDKQKEKLNALCQLISDLDSIRAFRRTKPEVIKEKFEKMKSNELMQLWKTIRHDVEKICYLPMEIQGLTTLMRLVAFLKMFVPLTSILVVLTIASQLRAPGKLLIPLPELFRSPIIFGIALTLSFSIMMALVLVDYTIRRRVVKYEEKHPEKLSRARERIKDVIEKLATKLAQELKRNNEDPNNFKATLFYKYEGLKVVKEKRGRFSRRKYPMYTVICSTTPVRNTSHLRVR